LHFSIPDVCQKKENICDANSAILIVLFCFIPTFPWLEIVVISNKMLQRLIQVNDWFRCIGWLGLPVENVLHLRYEISIEFRYAPLFPLPWLEIVFSQTSPDSFYR
jgi:hypothetical protein